MILTSIKNYSLSDFRADFFAGLIVAMVALPLCLAIAIASGAPPATGITTAVIAGTLISLFGGSHVQIGGPTGAFIVVVYDVIEKFGLDGLILATSMAGILLIIAALFRAGKLIRFIPEAVIQGFTLGIAIIIAKSQLASFTGWQDGHINWTAAMLGVATLAAIFTLRYFFPRLPTLLLTVVTFSALAYLLSAPVDTLRSLYGELPNHLSWPKLPEVSLVRIKELVPSALLIAFLAGIESLLSAMVADRITKSAHRPNAEIMAQGIANLITPLFGGIPATGAIARTSTNIQAGAKTPIAGVIHALAVWMMITFAAGLCGYMAMPSLAAVLIFVAFNMSEPKKLLELRHASKQNIALMGITCVLTVFVDLTTAITVGIILGLAFRLDRSNAPSARWWSRRR